MTEGDFSPQFTAENRAGYEAERDKLTHLIDVCVDGDQPGLYDNVDPKTVTNLVIDLNRQGVLPEVDFRFYRIRYTEIPAKVMVSSAPGTQGLLAKVLGADTSHQDISITKQGVENSWLFNVHLTRQTVTAEAGTVRNETLFTEGTGTLMPFGHLDKPESLASIRKFLADITDHR